MHIRHGEIAVVILICAASILETIQHFTVFLIVRIHTHGLLDIIQCVHTVSEAFIRYGAVIQPARIPDSYAGQKIERFGIMSAVQIIPYRAHIT